MSFLGLPRLLGLPQVRQPSAPVGQPARCIWLTGLPAAGKTTLASALEQRLREQGRLTCVLDGDSLRRGLCRDLGFSEADRVENIRRVAELARLMVEAGLTVMVALVSPFREQRRMARQLLSDGEFIEVFVDTPLEECAMTEECTRARRGVEGFHRNRQPVSGRESGRASIAA
jgi:bifunctional enzyme CysN/CysC